MLLVSVGTVLLQYVVSNCVVVGGVVTVHTGPYNPTVPFCITATQLTATYCGSTANSLSSSIKAIAAVGATGYRFRFINGTDTMIYDAPFRTVSLSNFALTEITSYCFYTTG